MYPCSISYEGLVTLLNCFAGCQDIFQNTLDFFLEKCIIKIEIGITQ